MPGKRLRDSLTVWFFGLAAIGIWFVPGTSKEMKGAITGQAVLGIVLRLRTSEPIRGFKC